MPATIGYYSTIGNDPQIIQGEYSQILNDPLYVQDEMQNIIPISDNSIFNNKNYEPPEISPENSVMIHGKGLKIAGQGMKSPDIMYGVGLVPAGGKQLIGSNPATWGPPLDYGKHRVGKNKKTWGPPIVSDKMARPYVDEQEMSVVDPRLGHRERQILINKIKEKRNKINRPNMAKMFKMEKTKMMKPGEGLKRKLLRRHGQVDIMTKRNEIKNLLDRLRR